MYGLQIGNGHSVCDQKDHKKGPPKRGFETIQLYTERTEHFRNLISGRQTATKSQKGLWSQNCHHFMYALKFKINKVE